MGDLPSLEDVLNKRFARLEDYPKAQNIVNNELKKLHKDQKIYGAGIYGSTRNKEIRIGSDIDTFIIVYSIKSCMPPLRALRSKIKSMYIELEINPLLSLKQAKEGRHGMEKSFLEYLKETIHDKDKIGYDIFNVLNENTERVHPALEFISRYESGLRRMTRECTQPMYTKPHCKLLSRMLNYTIFIPKDMYWIKYKKYDGHFTKKILVESYKKEFPHMDATALNHALLFWKETNKILSKDEVNIKDYKNILSWFSNQYDIIEKFILDNMKLAEQFKDK